MKNEAKIIGTILGIVLFIALVAGATYAYLLLKNETDLTTGTGKFSIDYKIVQNITATNLSPSTNKSGGLIGKVQAKLSDNSLAGNFNIYITPKTIDGLNTNEALKYEVYVDNSTTAYKTGSFKNITANTKVKVVDAYSLSSTSSYTTFTIYIWLDNNLVTNEMFGKTFNATISADSTAEANFQKESKLIVYLLSFFNFIQYNYYGDSMNSIVSINKEEDISKITKETKYINIPIDIVDNNINNY